MGSVRTIVCDRDLVSPWSSLEVFKRLKVDLRFSTSQHPETDGQTESTHGTIGQTLRSVVNYRQNNCEDVVPPCEFAYNDMAHCPTQNSPLFQTYGQNPLSAEDIHLAVTNFPMNQAARNWLEEKEHSLSIAKDCLQEAMVRQASYADRQRRDRKFSENQQVLVHGDHCHLSCHPYT